MLQTYLTRDKGYNDEAAKTLIVQYRATLAYAGLAEPAIMPDEAVVDEGARETAAGRKLGGVLSPPPPPPPIPPARVNLMQGERELTSGLLAKDASFRLIVTGEIGVREIERLIRKLELDKEILAEQADDESAP